MSNLKGLELNYSNNLVISTVSLLSVLGLSIIYATFIRRDSRVDEFLKKICGPPGVVLLGNALDSTVPNYELLGVFSKWRKAYGGVFKIWLLNKPFVVISEAKATEKILASSTNIIKSEIYEVLHPWLGAGLLTSHGNQWFTRRKLLTPAFHFKILEHFLEVFNEQAFILVQLLSQNHTNEKEFNIFPYITRCTLDVICETAMGKRIDAQKQHEQEYVSAVHSIGEITIQRTFRPWLRPELIWRLSWQGREERKLLKVLHGFTESVIAERRKERRDVLQTQVLNQGLEVPNNSVIGGKKRLAFLDLLLDIADENGLTDVNLREETDTFMFGGHDTTAANLVWTLYLLGLNPEHQRRAQEELDRIFGDERDKVLDMADLAKMKYLECCIKESLRIFPSAPLFSRKVTEDIVIDSQTTIPMNATAMICTYLLHRDASVFPNPEEFDPDRFSMENMKSRNPFAFVPFSAGPRNCIGQKFAMLEEKVILSNILVNFNLVSVDEPKDVKMVPDLILRPLDGIRVKLTRRNFLANS